MRHTASKIDFRRLAGEVEDSDPEVEVEQASIKKPIITSNKYHPGVQDDEAPRDACVCCHQVCNGEAASFVAQCWTNLNADAPGAVRLREALARHLSIFVPCDIQRLLCPNCQDDLNAVVDRIEAIK